MKHIKDVTSKDITRRGFLKLTAATGGAVVAGSALLDPAIASSECIDCHKIAGAPPRKQPHKWISTVCNMCGGQTGVLADVMTVENEKVVLKVVPNLQNPMGVSNVSEDFVNHKDEGAALCPRGNASIMDLYDHDRIANVKISRTPPNNGLWLHRFYHVRAGNNERRLRQSNIALSTMPLSRQLWIRPRPAKAIAQ